MSKGSIRDDYARDGFVVVRGLLAPKDVRQIHERFEEIWRDGLPGLLERDGERTVNSQKEEYPRVIHPHRFDALSKRYLLDKRITRVVSEMLDDEPLAAQSMYYWKHPGTPGQQLHQDNLYLKANDGTGCMAAWIAIDDCDEENGCMMVVPGSHRLELQCPERETSADYFFDDHVRPPDSLSVLSVPMKAGDALFFGGHTIHGSGPNRSATRARRSFICHYVGSRSTEIWKFYNPMLRMNGEELVAPDSTMGSPCGTAFDGPH